MKTIAVIPTYNEAANVGPLLCSLLALGMDGLECLVVDDASPDGTARIVGEMARERRGVHLLLRQHERGRGTAGLAGFRRALQMGADVAVEMDADFSHDPRHLPDIVAPILRGEADMVIGSRFIRGGRDIDRPVLRRILSTAARQYVRFLLGLSVEDVTSGYRAFSSRLLYSVELDTCRSRGPSILEEILFRAQRRGFRIVEVPIQFRDRARGQSTLTARILLDTLLFVAALRWRGW